MSEDYAQYDEDPRGHPEEPRNLPVPVDMSAKAELVAGGRIEPLIPRNFAAVVGLANVIYKSGLAPGDLNSPERVFVAIFHGLEIGLPPMMAVQKIAVINGRPAIWGDAAIALVESKGASEFIDEGCRGEGDDLTYFCRTKRKGKPNIVERTFSVKQAKRARLWDERPIYRKEYFDKATKTRKVSNYDTVNDSSWYKYPERMLQMRARGLCLRDVYADVLMGLYLREELDDGAPRETAPVEAISPPNPHQMEQTDGAENAGANQKEAGTSARPGGEAASGGADTDGAQPNGVGVGAGTEAQPGSVAGEGVAELSGGTHIEERIDPEAAAEEWIERLGQLSVEQEVRDYMTDKGIWEILADSALSRKAAALVEDAYNNAMTRAAAPVPPRPS